MENASDPVNASSTLLTRVPPLASLNAVWLRMSKQGSVREAALRKQYGRQGETDTGALDVERHGVHGDAAGDLPQPRPALGFSLAMGESLFHRLADRGRNRLRDHAGRSPPDRSHPGAA